MITGEYVVDVEQMMLHALCLSEERGVDMIANTFPLMPMSVAIKLYKLEISYDVIDNELVTY